MHESTAYPTVKPSEAVLQKNCSISTTNMRMSHQKVPFTMVANEVLTRADLSLKAKGLFAYLFSKPEGWQFSSKRMSAEMVESHPTILGILKELEEKGLLRRQRLQNGRVEYFLAYTEDSDISPGQETLLGAVSKNPQVKESHRGKSLPISNTELISNTEEKSNTETPGAFARKFFGGDQEAVGSIMLEFSKTTIPPLLVAREMLKFKQYWTELSRNGKKQKWELQETFDVKRRIGTWFRNIAERSGSTARRSGAGVSV